MFSFLKKKPGIAKRGEIWSAEHEPDVQARPTRRKIEYLKRLFTNMSIGSRVSYQPDFAESKLMVQTLVIGYKINDHFVFLPRDIEFLEEGPNVKIVIQTRDGPETFNRIDHIRILVPGDSRRNDRKLDHNSRASLGGRGSLTPKTTLILISTGGKDSNLNIKVEVEVERHVLLGEGAHKGMQVAVLDVQLGTLENHEPRKQVRIPCSLPAVAKRDGSNEVYAGTVIDYSDSAMRMVLNDPEGKWPALEKGRLVNIEFQPNPDKAPILMQCSCIKSRGCEAVFRMENIVRNGVAEPFSTVDALEIKIDLMNAQGAAT